ncbi:MAG: EamA family transporter [Anaerolineae bacterium]
MGILFLGAMGFAIRTILARRLATVERLTTLQITTINMGFGSLALLLLALRTGPLPALALKSLLIITLLSGVHTALPFTLWTHVLHALRAFQAGVISNIRMVQIAIAVILF